MYIITEELNRLDALSINALRAEFLAVVGYSTQSRNRDFLKRKIIWYRQAKKNGDISETARTRATLLADFRTLYLRLPGKHATLPTGNSSSKRVAKQIIPSKDARLPVPGSVLTRMYQGKEIRVLVLADGFNYEGKTYKSLSAIAREATGTRWNGLLFFGCAKSGGDL